LRVRNKLDENRRKVDENGSKNQENNFDAYPAVQLPEVDTGFLECTSHACTFKGWSMAPALHNVPKELDLG
jgi:hypothetical protein